MRYASQSHHLLSLGGVAVCFLLWASPALAQKTDIITLDNGDRITGEIKALERGKLRLSTDPMGTVYIEWDHIRRIRSDKIIEIELEAGERFFGSVQPSEEDDENLRITSGAVTTEVDLSEVVYARPLRDTFWQRLDGGIDLGFSFAQANTKVDYTLHAQTTYNGRDHRVTAELDSLFSRQDNTEDINRQNLSVTHYRKFGGRWFTTLLGVFQKNDELNLDFRGVGGGGAGRMLKQTGRVRLSLSGGAVYTKEFFAGEEDGQDSVEAFTNFRFDFFTFGQNETDVQTSFAFLPSLTDRGRFRVELTSRIRRELIKDFYFSVNLFESYDSQPPSTEATKNDFGISVGLGWSF